MKAKGIEKVLVTGGAGFIGSHTVDLLLKKSYKPVIIDNLEPQVHGKEQKKPDYLNKKAFFINQTIENKKIMSEMLSEVDAIIHLASLVGVGQSMYEINRYIETNTKATAALLDFLVKEKHNIKKIVVASSMSAYGEPETLPTPETAKMLPDSFYGIHKLASEHYIRIFSNEYGIVFTIFRLYTTYGHGQNLDNINQGLLSIYISQIINNDFVLVKGSKYRTRDIIHVSDVVNAIVALYGVDQFVHEPIGIVSKTVDGNDINRDYQSYDPVVCLHNYVVGDTVPSYLDGKYRLSDLCDNYVPGSAFLDRDIRPLTKNINS